MADKLDDDAAVAELDDLAEQDKLDAETVLARAVDPDSPLHAAFDWDDESAAHAHRLDQARRLIASYRRTIIVDDSPVVVRRFVRVTTQSGYVPVEDGLRDWRADLEVQAAKALRSWKLKYRHLGDETLTRVMSELE